MGDQHGGGKHRGSNQRCQDSGAEGQHLQNNNKDWSQTSGAGWEGAATAPPGACASSHSTGPPAARPLRTPAPSHLLSLSPKAALACCRGSPGSGQSTGFHPRGAQPSTGNPCRRGSARGRRQRRHGHSTLCCSPAKRHGAPRTRHAKRGRGSLTHPPLRLRARTPRFDRAPWRTLTRANEPTEATLAFQGSSVAGGTAAPAEMAEKAGQRKRRRGSPRTLACVVPGSLRGPRRLSCILPYTPAPWLETPQLRPLPGRIWVYSEQVRATPRSITRR